MDDQTPEGPTPISEMMEMILDGKPMHPDTRWRAKQLLKDLTAFSPEDNAAMREENEAMKVELAKLRESAENIEALEIVVDGYLTFRGMPTQAFDGGAKRVELVKALQRHDSSDDNAVIPDIRPVTAPTTPPVRGKKPPMAEMLQRAGEGLPAESSSPEAFSPAPKAPQVAPQPAPVRPPQQQTSTVATPLARGKLPPAAIAASPSSPGPVPQRVPQGMVPATPRTA